MCLRRHVSKLCTLREEERCSQLLPQESRPLSRQGPVTSFVPSWLRLATSLTLWPCRLFLAEAKRLKSALRNVASVGLSVQQSTSSGREGYRTYKSLPVLTEALSYQSSSTTAVSYLIARRGGSPFSFSRYKKLLDRYR